jgi:hypothetical protein
MRTCVLDIVCSMAETWWEYVQRISGETQQKAIAAAVDSLDNSTVHRWSKGVRPSADHAAAVARAYGDSPVAALIVAGYLKEDEVNEVVKLVERSLSERKSDELLDEIGRRLGNWEDGRRQVRAGLSKRAQHRLRCDTP